MKKYILIFLVVVSFFNCNKEKIVAETNNLLNNETAYLKMSKLHNPYGDGTACEKIVKFIGASLCHRKI